MAAALVAGGAALGAVSAIRSGNAEYQAQQYNAQMAEQNAALAESQAAEEERRQRVLAKKQLGDIRASYGASGITQEGSPTEILEESAANAELDALMIRHGGQVRASQYRNQAALSRFMGKEARIGGYLSAAGSLFRGAGGVAGMTGGGGGGGGSRAASASYADDSSSASRGYGGNAGYAGNSRRPKYTG